MGNIGNNVERQINVTDNLSRVIGAHQLKFGVDYRRLSPQQGLASYGQQAIFLSLTNVLTDNLAEAFIVARNADVSPSRCRLASRAGSRPYWQAH